MPLIINLSIFAQNGGHFVCYHGNRDLAEKIYVLLSKTHYTVWAETTPLTVQIKN